MNGGWEAAAAAQTPTEPGTAEKNPPYARFRPIARVAAGDCVEWFGVWQSVGLDNLVDVTVLLTSRADGVLIDAAEVGVGVVGAGQGSHRSRTQEPCRPPAEGKSMNRPDHDEWSVIPWLRYRPLVQSIKGDWMNHSSLSDIHVMPLSYQSKAPEWIIQPALSG